MGASMDSKMRKGSTFALAAVVLTLVTAPLVWADEIRGPVGGQDWFPSKWGADDQAGASNYMSPAKVMQATALITTGKVYQAAFFFSPVPIKGATGSPGNPIVVR